jgi:hypothetical protein
VKALPPARRLFTTWSKIREEIGMFYR